MKYGLAETAGRRQGVIKKAVIATSPAQIWICGRGSINTSATAVTTPWQSELCSEVVSATSMVADRLQQQLRRKLVLQDLVVVIAERWKLRQNKNNSSRTNFAWQKQQGSRKATARRQ